METKIAKTISYIFHPLIIPSYILLLLFNLNSYFSLLISPSAKLMILGMIFTITFILPLLSIFIFLKKGLVKTIQMETKEERVYPFIITAIFYYLAYYLLKQLQLSPVFYLFILGSTLLIIITLFINFYWKISIHMIAVGGMLGTFLGLSLILNIDITFLISLIILCAGFVGFARLKLNTHKPPQIYSGFLLGAAFMLLLFIF
ncbi:MAG: hypothetical protein K8R58_03735 [Bacteroidales bacterium]|nr:hypothetical protein [Bacteroidales bacterium]